MTFDFHFNIIKPTLSTFILLNNDNTTFYYYFFVLSNPYDTFYFILKPKIKFQIYFYDTFYQLYYKKPIPNGNDC